MTTLHEINQKARQALLTTLGPVDYTRYQQQFSQGAGDYTAERQQRTATTTEVIQQVSALKAAGHLVSPPNATVLIVESNS
ncbi:MAG: hypothetical protein IPK22_16275 [Verrucomicrobiaceae bacterium]|nr:hypothetical protein [Verrucomicrobiaceae bacterium]